VFPSAASGSPRVVRAGLGAAVAAGVAVAAHAAGHGQVDAVGAGWAFVALVGPSWWLARRRRGWGVLALTQLAGQQIAHLMLSVGDAVVPHAVPADLMLYGHLLAAAVSAWWLMRGEPRAWAGLCRWVMALLRATALRLPSAPVVAALRQQRPASHDPRGLRHVVIRRGPPLAVV